MSAGEATPPRLPAVIETERLYLRHWELGDVDAVLAYAWDPEWSRYLHVLPRPYGRHDAEQFVARQILLDPVTHPSWAIVLDGAAVGGVNLRIAHAHRLAELGYSIARRHWNQGYVSEAATAVLAAAFTTLPELQRIRAFADARNRASQRVMEKIGMTKEGVLRQNRVERGEAIDEAWFGILRDEWGAGAGGAAPEG